MEYQRFVALGDSFTEGVGDHDQARPNGVCGWADRFAAIASEKNPSFRYANLAIRGRKMLPILGEQIAPALALKPDLVSIYAGANDIMRPKVDIDTITAAYERAIATLVAAGPRVVIFTAYDPGSDTFWGALRGRFAIYTEQIREIAERHDVVLVDYWRFKEYRDERLWDEDKMHMSAAGHQNMAMRVADALGLHHEARPLELKERPVLSGKERRAETLRWTKEYAGPWVKRRLTRTSSGDLLSPKYPDYVDPTELPPVPA